MPQDFLRSAGMTGFNSNNHENYHYIERRIFDELQGPNIKQESLYLFLSASRPAPLESMDHLPSRTPKQQQSVSIQIKLRETAEILCICKNFQTLGFNLPISVYRKNRSTRFETIILLPHIRYKIEIS